jgi:uncharacterized membrane protein
MNEVSAAPRKKSPRLIRIIRMRPRLFLSAALGIVVIMITLWAFRLRLATSLLIGWDIGVGIYLILAFNVFARADVAHIRRRALTEDDGRFAILILTAAAALASLAAIVAELGTSGATREPMRLGLAALTIVLSWFFTHTMFALHYAHEFYSTRHGKDCCLQFPGAGDPDYWDFVYFSFVIGMTAQVSDVQVATKSVRRTVLAHGIVAFLFNAALLALTVNIAANAIGQASG